MLKREIEYFLILWLYASVIVKLVNYYYPINFNIELFYVTNYVGYFLLGYYLSNYDIAKNGETYLILGNFRVYWYVLYTHTIIQSKLMGNWIHIGMNILRQVLYLWQLDYLSF